MPNKTIYVGDVELWQWLQRYAKQTKQPLSRVILQALRIYRVRHDPEPARSRDMQPKER